MRTNAAGVAVCVLLAGGLGQAQEGARTEPAEPVPAHATMIVTGCLAAGPDEMTFLLNNAAVVEGGEGGAGRPVGTAGAPGDTEFELVADSRLDQPSVSPDELKPLVGRQVEVTARPAEAAVTPPTPTATGAPPATAEKVEPGADPPAIKKLTVTAVKQLSVSCR